MIIRRYTGLERWHVKLAENNNVTPDEELKDENTQETVDEEITDAEETAEDTAEDTEAKEDDASGEKKSFFKKDKKKDKKDQLIEELTDKYKRTFAEFDNFRKRSEKEKTAMYEIGAKDIVERILPIVDNFERGLATVPEEDMNEPFVDGMSKIYKQLMKALEDAGVKPIEAVGTEFDPNFHNAVMHVEDEELGENIVAEELQKGYMYRDTVVRHSMVKVAN